MPSRKPSRKDLLSACSDPGAGDGQDPRYDRPGPEGRPQGRKSMQLCKQVEQTVQQVLLGCGDEVLRDLEVLSATPIGGGRLLVSVKRSASAAERDSATILAHLERARGLLRSEVAGAVHRRKTPDLVFGVVA
jgi:ribosome-binding factor A